MKIFISKHFFSISISLLLILMALAFWLGIRPLYERVGIQRDEIQKFHTTRENRSRQLGTLADLRKQFEGIVSDEHILNILLTDDQIVDFIKIVEEEAKAADVEVTITAQGDTAAIVEPQAKKSAAGAAKKLIDEVPFSRYLPLNVNVMGSYENTVLFLHRLETLPIALDVVALTTAPRTEEGSPLGREGGNPNPFGAVLGDPLEEASQLPLRSAEDLLESTFEVLVYTDKKTP